MTNQIEAFNGFKKFTTGKEFEKHIRNSIPNYRGMRAILPNITENFVTKNSNVYDIGCSSGDLLLELNSWYKASGLDLSFVGYDIADNLLPNLEYAPNCSFFPRNVSDPTLKLYNTSLVFSLFTLQFIHIDKRKLLIQKIYDSLSQRGAFIVCEKITADNGLIEDIYTFTNYDQKEWNGFTYEEILSKQRKLRTKMQVLSQSENEQLFKDAGFKTISVFWKSLNFIGWILVK